MSDPRHAHEFWSNKKGKCKQIVGSQHCGRIESDIVHVRFKEKQEEIENQSHYSSGQMVPLGEYWRQLQEEHRKPKGETGK